MAWQAHTAGSTFSLFFFSRVLRSKLVGTTCRPMDRHGTTCLPLPGKVEYSTAARKKYYCAREEYILPNIQDVVTNIRTLSWYRDKEKNEQMHQFCCSAPLLVHCTRVLERFSFSWVLDGSRVCLIYVSYMGRSQPWDRTAFEHENRRKVQNWVGFSVFLKPGMEERGWDFGIQVRILFVRDDSGRIFDKLKRKGTLLGSEIPDLGKKNRFKLTVFFPTRGGP